MEERNAERESKAGEAADERRTPVTVVGLGAMSSALAGSFLERGRATTVWNRSAGKADAPVARGATRAAIVADTVAAGGLVVVCLLGYEIVRGVLHPLSHALSGRILVDLTNGTPQQAREKTAWAAEHGAQYLDGGTMAVPPTIESPEAMILRSRSWDEFESHQKDLDALGTSVYLGADPGLIT
jgi:3-hydroxyisobutyrate dehydrogenase-like beta-hydroxyacid dehydrogenase